MKLKELIEQNKITKMRDKYKCNICSKVYTKIGITNHFFYCHTKEGKLKKEKLRKISLKNNNTIEMKKKISKGTIKAYQRKEVKNNYLKAITSKEYKNKSRLIQKELWKDSKYRKRQTKKIIKSNTTQEFRNKISKALKITHNQPDSKVQSKEYSQACSKRSKELWKDSTYREKQKEGRKDSWSIERRLETSKRIKKMWKNPEHIEKVLNGKIKYLKKTGKKPSLGCYGQTELGTIYESRFEQKVFEFLEKEKITFIPHVNLPNSSKISDLIINDIWIELDGLKRDIFNKNSKFSWNGKIEIYQELKEKRLIKDFKIFNNVNDFKSWFYRREYEDF